MASNSKETSAPDKDFIPVGSGTFEVAQWRDGGTSVKFKVDHNLRSFVPTDKNPEPSDKYIQFKEYGEVPFYKGDAYALLAVVRALLPAGSTLTLELPSE